MPQPPEDFIQSARVVKIRSAATISDSKVSYLNTLRTTNPIENLNGSGPRLAR